MRYPPKPSRGDSVAVLSPSGRSAAEFPAPYELGLQRLRDELGLVPVEFPTTRAPEASPEARAADVNAAFADPEIKAVIASIGGEDEIKVLPYLDQELLAANPKPFFGYSDNTNLHVVLWNLGLVSYHGAAVMVQLGRPGAMHPLTRESLERALFESGPYELKPSPDYGDEERDWEDPAALRSEPAMFPSEGWTWHGPETRVTGRLWGGCLEILDFHLRANRWLQENGAYRGAVLFLETSEELPSDAYVYRVLMGMGERGLLQQFAAVLWARPKAWSFEQRNTPVDKAAYIDAQRDAVLAALAEYHPGVPLVFGLEFGHTDPQYVLPMGGDVTVDPAALRIDVTY